MDDLKEGFWYRDGKLLFTVQPFTWARGKKSWENSEEIRFDLGDMDLVKANDLINRIQNFLNEEGEA